MDKPDEPLGTTGGGVKNTGRGSGLTGGPNPGEPGHGDESDDAADSGQTSYSPEMGSVVRRPDRDDG